jgi:hypothetical protein
MTQVSALDMIPFGAHLGKAPRFRMSRVVSNEPDSVCARDTTSQETTCAAYGLGYRKKKASDTIDQGSLWGSYY